MRLIEYLNHIDYCTIMIESLFFIAKHRKLPWVISDSMEWLWDATQIETLIVYRQRNGAV